MPSFLSTAIRRWHKMGGQPAVIQGSVAPAKLYDISTFGFAVDPGTYQAFWSMRNAQGRTFGDRIWAGIRVPSPATATPAPPKPRQPTSSSR
ncbi:MAG: hypothetical protein IPH82_10585 [Chloroflexi bacterium]|nr:hypothetical protein [Chloroflexota bacterium]